MSGDIPITNIYSVYLFIDGSEVMSEIYNISKVNRVNMESLLNNILHIKDGSHNFLIRKYGYHVHKYKKYILICLFTPFYRGTLIHSFFTEFDDSIEDNLSKIEAIDIVKKLVTKYNHFKEWDNFAKIEKKVDDIKTVIHENINKSLENCEKLETIEVKSEELLKDSYTFRDSTRRIKNKMWWKNIKIKCIIFSTIAVIFTIIIVIAVETNKK